ncbi:MAG: hypothetical protein EOO85_27785 [Pedobacter sp.]|nr:MAG: hypothetical protein EOO85_27785 [Pedobacter sp.]
MAYPRAFISYDYDNNSPQKLYFVGQIKNSRTPFNVEDWSSKTHLPERQWEELIHAKINKCNVLIILVGRRMSTATGVVREIAFAKANNVPIFGVYVDDANSSSTLPIGLSRGRTIDWTWGAIADAIEQCMTEGKNG